jgi:uncharacterized protein YbaR (Trm112 family)
MHIEFVDLLRCPAVHEDSWLIAAVTTMEGRIVVEAKLGCPVCGASYLVRDGVALFDEKFPSQEQDLEGDSDPDAPMKIAAFLDLTRPGAVALLAGDWAAASAGVAELAGARILSLNAGHPTRGLENVAEIRATARVPVADSSMDGAALDVKYSDPEMIDEAARLLRPRGRLIAAGTAELPPQFRELARDENHVVAEYVGELVSLRR